jgi:hypothetical protein
MRLGKGEVLQDLIAVDSPMVLEKFPPRCVGSKVSAFGSVGDRGLRSYLEAVNPIGERSREKT